MAGNAAEPGRTVTGRVLALLGAFDRDHRALRLVDLAARAGLAVPTAHRLVGELAAGGVLVRDDEGRWVIGRRLWDLGLLSPVPTDLREAAAPFLQDLYGATLATVHLAVRDGTSALYVDRLRGSASVPVLSTVGGRLPLSTTGVGKVLLAHAPDDVRAAVLAELPRCTPYSVTQPGRLARQLERVRQDGYAQTAEEMSLGACSVAVPVRSDGAVTAALGVVVAHVGRDRARLVAALRVAALGIERQLATS